MYASLIWETLIGLLLTVGCKTHRTYWCLHHTGSNRKVVNFCRPVFRRISKISKSDCYCRRVCPSVRTEKLGSHRTDVIQIWCLSPPLPPKTIEGIQVTLKRPHCVNQMGKTQSKPLAERHAGERHGMCESAFSGTAWARHGMCEFAFNVSASGVAALMTHCRCIPKIVVTGTNQRTICLTLASRHLAS
jgi:hypothetical protein